MNYKLQRTKKINNLLEEKGFICCERCNVSNARAFHVHHIMYRSEKPKHPELHNLDNLIILCNDCHDWFHNKKVRRASLVESRNLKELFG